MFLDVFGTLFYSTHLVRGFHTEPYVRWYQIYMHKYYKIKCTVIILSIFFPAAYPRKHTL